MARHASTYRQARRAAWQANNALSMTPESWDSYNAKEKSWNTAADAKRFGPVRSEYVGSPLDRSKYVPHTGAKQLSKAKSIMANRSEK